MVFDINERTKIYVQAPYQFGGGGGESLHQFIHKLSSIRSRVFVVYRDCMAGGIKANGTPTLFRKLYPGINEAMEVEDSPDNILISPEVWTKDIEKKFTHIQLGIYWLSVFNNGNSSEGGFTNWGDRRIRHICQSRYALDFIRENGAEGHLIFDYISKEVWKSRSSSMKTDKLCYNPAKGKEITDKIIQNLGVQAIALQNMNRKDLMDTLGYSKIYIDFGHHPGMDRMPREAVINGCCLIVGRNGSANFDIDVPEKFKFHNHEIPEIQERIRDCILNYGERIGEFDSYYKEICGQEQQCEQQIRGVFA